MKYRFLAPVLFLIGVLAWSDRMLLPVQGQDKKVEEKNVQDAPRQTILPDQLSAPNSGSLQLAERLLLPPIDPKTPVKDLLPAPPPKERGKGPVLTNDLSRVPEVRFQSPSIEQSAKQSTIFQIAKQIANINHLNKKSPDGFIEAMRESRPDLMGLPFAMGDACRTKGERSKQFTLAVALVRRALQATTQTQPMPSLPPPVAPPPPPLSLPEAAPPLATAPSSASRLSVSSMSPNTPASAPNDISPEVFWRQYLGLCAEDDKERGSMRCEQKETITLARLAALSQILMPMAEMHPGLVKHLSTISHAEATRALARMAIFSGDAEVRKAAIDGLSVRRERDYTAILVDGLRYPWPAVAQRAAEAIATLERKDLLPILVEMLEKPDPRTPLEQEVQGKRVPTVRELVRINHHRSCLMCHAPGNTGKVSPDAVSAEVPLPDRPLNSPSGPYNSSRQEILVRVDVTYLRQDFSVLQAVADANPWPEMQRFDFLVRQRVLTDDEATTYRDKLKPREEGEFSPYHRAALVALRNMTGRDTEPTPQAWRKLLKLKTD